MILSPISGEEALILEHYKPSEFVNAWEYAFGIDVSDQFIGVENFYKCLCPSSQYEFFFPLEVEGNAQLYEELSKLEWYYMANKWEHRMAIEEIKPAVNTRPTTKILEVGCGFGDFLEICNSSGVDGIGIELNQEAVAYAKRKGRNVEGINVFEFEKGNPSQFNTVVSFQVLEHIANPLPFIKSCINLLSPNGSIILTVPDGHGFCSGIPSIENLLDSPHHMGKWNISAFQYLTKILPIRLDKVMYEPLQSYHLNWYIDVMLNTGVRDKTRTQNIIRRTLSKILISYVKKYDIYSHWKGATLYVKFTKCN